MQAAPQLRGVADSTPSCHGGGEGSTPFGAAMYPWCNWTSISHFQCDGQGSSPCRYSRMRFELFNIMNKDCEPINRREYVLFVY